MHTILQFCVFPHHRGWSHSARNYLVYAECRLFTINRRLSKQFKEVIHKHRNVAVVAKQLTDLNDFCLDVATHKIFVVILWPIHF